MTYVRGSWKAPAQTMQSVWTRNISGIGFGFRCGFLGLLHMDVIQERLEREFSIDLIMTAPSVIYKVNMTDGASIDVSIRRVSDPDQRLTLLKSPMLKGVDWVLGFVSAVMELAQ